MHTVLIGLRSSDSRPSLLRELEWLIGPAFAPVFTRLEPETPFRDLLGQLEPTLVALTNDEVQLLSRGRDLLVAQAVRRSRVPIYVVPRPGPGRTIPPRPTRILVPLDGTERAATVLGFVEGIARVHQAEVVLTRVGGEGLGRPLLTAYTAKQRLAESLDTWRDWLAARGTAVTAVAGHGSPVRELVRLAAQECCDLIAMTTRGRTRWERLLDRSVFEGVLRRTSLPIVVLPTPTHVSCQEWPARVTGSSPEAVGDCPTLSRTSLGSGPARSATPGASQPADLGPAAPLSPA